MFRVGSRVRQTPEEGRRKYRPKRCEYNNKDEDKSPKTLNDENPKGSSQKFRQAFNFLSLRVLGLLSSSLLLFPQRFGRYVLQPSSGVSRTREPSRNFELRPLLNPRGSPVLIPLAITGYKC